MSYISATQYFDSTNCQKYPETIIWKVSDVPVKKDMCVSFSMEGFVGGYEIKEYNEISKIRLFENIADTCQDPLTEWQTLNDTNCFNIFFQGRNESFKIELYDRHSTSSASIIHISMLFIIIITLKYIF